MKLNSLLSIFFSLVTVSLASSAEPASVPASAPASQPAGFSAKGSYERFLRTKIVVTAPPEFAGRKVRIRQEDKELGAGQLKAEKDSAVAVLTLPMPPRGQPFGYLMAAIEGLENQLPVSIPNADTLRQRRFCDLGLKFRPFVFTGALPSGDLEDPILADLLIGPYTLKTTYYDQEFNPVTAATKHGRYGAVVEITAEDGAVYHRYATLYRLQWGFDKNRPEAALQLLLPEATGIDPAVLKDQADQLAEFTHRTLARDLAESPQAAILLAALSELQPGAGKLNKRLDPDAMNQKWWFILRKKLGLPKYQSLVYPPEGFAPDKGKKYPLILFLHGSGERGEIPAHLEVVRNTLGPHRFLGSVQDSRFLVVALQCRPLEWWNPWEVLDQLDEIEAKYPVDKDRIYLTGLSMGGFGSWTTALLAPERFAAVVPICGGGDATDVARIKDLPIWVFHGGKDNVVPIRCSREMVDALTRLAGRVKFTVYPEEKHASWIPAYKTPELYDWLLAQRKGAPAQPPATPPASAPTP